MLISAVMPIMLIYHLPLGQYGYTGHVINLPQDVVSFALSLPRLSPELDVLVVRKNSEQSHRDFHVRRSVVQQALTWLLNNNRYYRANAEHINEEALQQLPEDEDLSNLTSLPTSDPQSESSQDDLYGAHLSHRLFLMLHSKGQNKRQSSNLFKTCRVAHTPSHGPPLEEHPSMSLQQRATSAWPSPPCSPLEYPDNPPSTHEDWPSPSKSDLPPDMDRDWPSPSPSDFPPDMDRDWPSPSPSDFPPDIDESWPSPSPSNFSSYHYTRLVTVQVTLYMGNIYILHSST